jgi:type IV pilus assembly protein PilC
MNTYIYKLKDQNGKTLFGLEEATNKEELRLKLRAANYYFISADPFDPQKIFKQRLDLEGLLLFTYRLGSLIEAGIPILSGLNILWRQTEDKTMQLVIHYLRRRLEEGETLSSALSDFPGIFPALYVALIKVAEKTGGLPAVLQTLRKYLQYLKDLITRIKKAAIYPAIVIGFAVLVLLGMFTFVVPVFQNVLMKLKVELPLLTRIILAIAQILKSPIFLLSMILLFVAGFIIYRKLKRDPVYAYRIDSMKLKIPLVGHVYYLVCMSRFVHALSVLFSAGLPILESFEVAKSTTANRKIARAIDDVSRRIEQGDSVYTAFQGSKIFPTMLVEMVGVGESGGVIAKILENLANYFDEEVDYKLNKLLTIMEPLLIIFVGAIVLITLLAIYLPIFAIWKGLIQT